MNSIDKKKNLKGSLIAIACILAFWGILLLVENLNLMFPDVPKLFTPTSKLFMVLRKVIVYFRYVFNIRI